jgi:hypothetical protein
MKSQRIPKARRARQTEAVSQGCDMATQETDESIAQRRDAMLLRLLKMPPASRAQISERVRREKAKKVDSASCANARGGAHADR